MTELGKIVDELVCPDCGNKEFSAGPRGGLAQNVRCDECGCKLNICPLPVRGIWIREKLRIHD